jgi:hypothetical protein
MKPITAEDLVVGGKYVYKDKLHTYCGLCEQNDFVFYDENYYYIFLKDLSHVTPYHEPNQTTMNTEFTEQRNQETHQFNEWLDVFEIISNCINLGLSELERHSILSNRFELKQKDTDTYHEPNQTTMNTEFTEQPFNLETALKHPELVRTRDGREIDFIKKYPNQIFEFNIVYVTKCGCVDIVNCNGLSSTFGREHNNDLILRMPYQTVWFNVYKNTGYSSKEEADGVACPSDLRIACVPVKIPAI